MKKLLALIVVALLGFYVGWPAYSGYQIHAALEADDADVLARKIDFPQVRASIRAPVLAKINSRINELVRDFGAGLGVSKEQIKTDRIAQIVDGALEEVVAPERLGPIYKRGGDIKGEIQQAVLRRIDKTGGFMELLDIDDAGGGDNSGGEDATIGGFNVSDGIGGLLKNKKTRKIFGDVASQLGGNAGGLAGKLFPDTPSSAASGGDGKRSFDFANVKRLGFAGPLAMELGVARDRDAVEPDVTARMSFQDFDWKVTRLTPNLDAK
ncbi:MAG: DUF2939 domain-containing protein [Hyphomicrobiaceae bacterium]